MRAWDMDVRLELEDDDATDQLEILTVVKTLLETLAQFEKVSVSIEQVEEHDDGDHHEEAHTEEKVEVEAGDYRFSVAA